MSDVVLGFDPGGQNKFGWALGEDLGEQLRMLATGVVSDAQEAVATVSRHLPSKARVAAAGIDAPLFWGAAGNRCVDKLIRRAVAERGHAHASGTVQAVNSLRGACLVQGVLLAKLLTERFLDASITEAHPKALLWLLKHATSTSDPTEAGLQPLSSVIEIDGKGLSEHQRDAVLAAFAAWSMCKRLPGWRDLFPDEREAVRPLGIRVSYWMPLPQKVRT